MNTSRSRNRPQKKLKKVGNYFPTSNSIPLLYSPGFPSAFLSPLIDHTSKKVAPAQANRSFMGQTKSTMEHTISAPISTTRHDAIPASTGMTTAPAPARLLFIDNLRWVMIMLVLSMHAAVTYSGHGSWYVKETAHLGLPQELIFVTYQVFLQSFFMGLLFFVAGYFVPGSL